MSMRRRSSISSSMLVIRDVDDEETDSDGTLAAASDAELDVEVIVRLSGSVPVSKVARWQNLIPSFLWIAPGWRASAQSKER